ncbi:MAG TPA: diguanylate cyclase [Acidobacteriota bacterium]|nr:diguanylate cyclase [Acidobacteriota bacterium]
MKAVYFRTDMDGVITDVDPSISQYGYAPGELIGHAASPRYIRSAEFDALFPKLKKFAVVCDYAVRLNTKSGETLTASLDARLVYDSDGRPMAVDGVLREVGKSKSFTRREHDDVTQKLLMVLTHEIHNPLTGIIGNLSLFQDENISAANRERLQEIEKYAQEIRSYLAELRDLDLPERDALSESADPISIIHQIERQRLEYSLRVITDQLTETYNRHFFNQFLEREMVRSKRYGYTAMILLIVVEDFKNIQERFGRAVANRILIESAFLLKSCIRNSDIIAREGENNFLILLPETELKKSRFVLSRIQDKLLRRNQAAEEPLLHFRMKSTSCASPEDGRRVLAELLESAHPGSEPRA